MEVNIAKGRDDLVPAYLNYTEVARIIDEEMTEYDQKTQTPPE
jgi:hypothetical protein